LEVYNILSTPSLLSGRKIWTLILTDVRCKAAEMKFMRPTGVYSLLDHGRSEDILELNVDAMKKIAQYKQKWLNHVSRREMLDLSEEELDDH
jgi:hypothetical protein